MPRNISGHQAAGDAPRQDPTLPARPRPHLPDRCLQGGRVPGVHAILSRENCADWHTYWYMIPQPAFPEVIAYAGQEVAVVAAEDVDVARRPSS